MYNIIFPSYPGSKLDIDFTWKNEMAAAQQAGFSTSLLCDSYFDLPMSISFMKKDQISLYRGWILKPLVYKDMDNSLGLSLFNNYDHYLWSYEFPRWNRDLPNTETPNSLFYTEEEIQELGLEILSQHISERIGSKSIIIKDWLKSRKHEWYDACFIRDASDMNETIRVMSNFFKFQGQDFYGGLVFRDFLNLKKIGFHPKSSMPLSIEFRTFFLNSVPIFTTPYWSFNDISYPQNVEYPPKDWLNFIGSYIRSPFVALDIAQDENGKWWIIEVNDGGSAGLPSHVDLEEFYNLLYISLNKNNE